ncbi:hypothetical protein BrE312_1324 [Brenneria sp. EniD312]|nr:hypothetical protein BrE312_1324 [Brenneria sp. EniD312]
MPLNGEEAQRYRQPEWAFIAASLRKRGGIAPARRGNLTGGSLILAMENKRNGIKLSGCCLVIIIENPYFEFPVPHYCRADLVG